MRRILPTIVIAQFFCTSLWFAGNAVIKDIVREFNLSQQFLAHLTSAVQLGFISGTLVFALLTVADRFSPSKVFFVSAVLAGLFNIGITITGINAASLLLLRVATGFFLAGIYPVGMKIASDYFEQGLGKSLGYLVGALVIGTALPHLIKNFSSTLPWKYVLYGTTILSLTGGLLMLLLVPDGPYRRASQQIKFNAFLKSFKNPAFRSVAFGYFGHMWEVYTFWAFVPVMIAAYNQYNAAALNSSLLSFIIIGGGGIACVFSGLLSQQYPAKKIATIALLLSAACCLLSPLFLLTAGPYSFSCFLFFWGLVVIADSPLFSSLVAANAIQETRGTSLTIVNCIGFSITILSIQFINAISSYFPPQYIYMLLAIGPILGQIALWQNKN
jgi:MFS family permease